MPDAADHSCRAPPSNFSMTMQRRILCFGSNLAGRHGAGSARHAYINFGAELGVGVGLTGDAYAIPTKDHQLNVLPIREIERYVEDFIGFAEDHPSWTFEVVAIGTGLAGFTHAEMAPLFRLCPKNCQLPREWLDINEMVETPTEER